MHTRRVRSVVGLIALPFTTAAGVYLASTPAPEAQSVTRHPVTVEQILRNPPHVETAPAPRLSARELEALRLRKLELRERLDSLVDNNPPSPPGLPHVPGRETQVVDPQAEFHGTPGTFVIGRNNPNPMAATSGVGSTLAEPGAANNGVHVFYTGNTHAEFSTDGGATYTAVTIPGGPDDAPIACCDLDVLLDNARRVTFWSVLYLNSGGTNGVIRIFVRPDIPLANSCSYDIDPAGTANNITPDYPHLGLSNNHLYLTTNNIGSAGWVGAQVRRFNIDQMADCAATVTTDVFTYKGRVGQRVLVPAQGAWETIYWGMLENTTTFRIFQWKQTSPTPTSVTRIIQASTFANPDCRGGVGNFDFIERSTAWSITGFRLRGAVGKGQIAFFWNVGPDSAHPQGHVHAAVFSEGSFSLLAQPHIFNSAFCFGYPAVAANKRGDLGMTIAAGGKAGGGGTAAQGFVGMDDDFTSGIGNFGTFALTAAGTHNRSDGRYGDYFTAHPWEPCEKWFNATNYALNGGSATTNVNARYVEFGRNRDKKCYDNWNTQAPTP